jgi:hypothetical protein
MGFTRDRLVGQHRFSLAFDNDSSNHETHYTHHYVKTDFGEPR